MLTLFQEMTHTYPVRFKVILSIVVLVASISPLQRSASAESAEIDDTWFFEQPTTDGWHGIKFADRQSNMDRFSYLKKLENFHGQPCASTTEGRCADSAAQEFSSIIPICGSSTSVNCIVSFGSIDASGAKTAASFSRLVPTAGSHDFAAEPAVDLPAGGSGQLWELSSATHPAGSNYFTRVRLAGSRKTDGKFTHSALDIGLFATKPTEVPCTGTCFNRLQFNQSLGSWELNGPGDGAEWNKTCVATSETNGTTSTCLERKAFPLDKRFYITLRLSQSPTGWLHGRLSAPEVSLTTDSSGVTTVDIAGRPTTVPVISTGMNWSALPTSLQKVYEKGMWPGSREDGGTTTSRQYVPKTNPAEANVLRLPSPSGKAGIEELEAWLPLVSDKATANVSTWGMRTLSSTEMAGATQCITNEKGVAGIVTTNATQYSAGPPIFVKDSGTLDYKVAAPHLTSGGRVFPGDYNLVMKSTVARCIYGFTSAPISMSISVVDTGGSTSTATTSVSERDGWIKLSAIGFSHSSPTIRASLTQTPEATTSTTPVATPTTPVLVAPNPPSMRVGKSLTPKSVANMASLKLAKNSRLSLSVSTSSQKVCGVKAGRLVAKKKGTCRVTVTSSVGKKKSKKTVSIAIR